MPPNWFYFYYVCFFWLALYLLMDNTFAFVCYDLIRAELSFVCLLINYFVVSWFAFIIIVECVICLSVTIFWSSVCKFLAFENGSMPK